MAKQSTKEVPFRCKNRYGSSDQKVPKCGDYGSKGHPGNIVNVKEQELPPGNRLPKCPCCGLELEPVNKGAGKSVQLRLYAPIGIAVLLVVAVVSWFLWPSPPPPRPSVEVLLKEVWPSLR